MILPSDSRGKGDSPSYFYSGESRAGQSQVDMVITSSSLEVCLQAWLAPSPGCRPRRPLVSAGTIAVAPSLLSQSLGSGRHLGLHTGVDSVSGHIRRLLKILPRLPLAEPL